MTYLSGHLSVGFIQPGPGVFSKREALFGCLKAKKKQQQQQQQQKQANK